CIAENIFDIGIGILESYFYFRVFLGSGEINNVRMYCLLVPVYILHKRYYSALIVQFNPFVFLVFIVAPFIGKYYCNVFIQECQLPEPLQEDVKLELYLVKYFRIRAEGCFGPCPVGITYAFNLCYGYPFIICLVPDLALPVNLNFHCLRKGIYNRGTNSMQSARDLISLTSELPAGMKRGMDHFKRRY